MRWLEWISCTKIAGRAQRLKLGLVAPIAPGGPLTLAASWDSDMTCGHFYSANTGERSKLSKGDHVASATGLSVAVVCVSSGNHRAPWGRAGFILWSLVAALSGSVAALGSLSAQVGVTSPRSPSDSADVVRPGDLIRLKIWREPEMSGDVAVDEEGVA